MNPTAAIWLISLPLVASPVVYLAGHSKTFRGLRLPQVNSIYVARGLALAALAVMWVAFAGLVGEYNTQGQPITFGIGSISMHVDGVSLLMAGLILILGSVVTLFSIPDVAEEEGQEKYYAMTMATLGAMIGLVCSGDLFNLWVWFETMVVSSYVLTTFFRERPASLEAGMKYLMQSATGSILVLLGIALVLSQTGTLSFSELQANPQSTNVLLLAGALFVVGFGIKTAMVPFHTWLPDAYTQSPNGISAILSGAVTATGMVTMLRALSAVSADASTWGTLLMGFGAINMITGNLLALRQREVKRLLAYSSITHIGYMLLGVGVGLYMGTAAGIQAGFFHLLNHGLMKALAFLAVGALIYAVRPKTGERCAIGLDDLAGTARRYPLVVFVLILAILSLAGIPPLAGFVSKWQVFSAGVEANNALVFVFVLFGVFNALLSLGYYLPLINAIFRSESNEAEAAPRLPLAIIIPLVVLAAAIIIIGLWPESVRWFIESAGNSLIAAFVR